MISIHLKPVFLFQGIKYQMIKKKKLANIKGVSKASDEACRSSYL